MNRRVFLGQAVLAGAAACGLGSCTRDLRQRLMAGPEAGGQTRLNPLGRQILFYASLAPSGHNSQPWFVRLEAEDQWVIGADPSRRLPEVDPENREVLLSVGAFIENLDQAAKALGFGTEVTVLAQDRFDPEVARVRIFDIRGPQDQACLARMAARRTVKTGLAGKKLDPTDLARLKQACQGGLYYFPRGSSHAAAMAEAAVENFQIQFNNPGAMEEAARWTRLSDHMAEQYRDGLTPDGMEIHGVAGWWVRHFMDPRDVMGQVWREKAVEKVRAQVLEGGGWLVLTSPSKGVADLLEAGRRFQRLALEAVPLGIGIHPMTQTLEEANGQAAIRSHHDGSLFPQFMLRVGYARPYPPPKSLRRPVDWFVTG